MPKSILISFFGRGFGDCIYFSGILKAFRTHFPGAHIRLAVLVQMQDYFQNNPFIDELVLCPDYMHSSISGYIRFFASAFKLRSNGSVDLLLNLCPTLSVIPAFWDFFIPKKFSLGIGDSLKQIFYDKAVPIDWKKHYFECLQDALRALDIPIQEPSFWTPPLHSAKPLENLRSALNGVEKAVFVSPGGKRNIEAPKEYCWTFEGFPFVIEKLLAHGHSVILTGAGYDEMITRQIKPHPLLINLIGKTTLPELFEIVKNHARLVVCNNSGILHVASVLNIPTVSYADPEENILRWGPYPADEKHIVLQATAREKIRPEEFMKAILNQLSLK